MAIVPTKEPAPGRSTESIEQRFRRLESQWNAETAHLSSTSKIVGNAAFQEIIGMGPAVIPYMLRDLKERPRLWVWALQKITGVDLVPDGERGGIAELSQAWLHWGKENGYEW
jgi:hypothetical protein